jgi:6-phosphofructokinase 2
VVSYILSITMNPAVDVSTSVERIEPNRKLRCAVAQRDPGGGGINVSRVVSRLGRATRAIYPIGGIVGDSLKAILDAEGVRSIVVPIQAETREDFTVFEKKSGDQFRFVVAGPQLSGREWRECLEKVEAFPEPIAFLVASGSLPPGVPDDFYALLSEIARERGALFAVDSSGAPLKAAVGHGVDLLKPSLHELCDLIGRALTDELAYLAACESLIETGKAKIVALTLGAQGALLVTQNGAWRAKAPAVKAASTVGAGDSFLGAMIWALCEGASPETAFRFGVAAGSATLLSSGTQLCSAADIHRFFESVALERRSDGRWTEVGVEAVADGPQSLRNRRALSAKQSSERDVVQFEKEQ